MPLPLWTLTCLAAGIFVGYQSRYLKTSNINIIAGGLILTIPLQAWIDVKFIHDDKSWGIRIGFVILGMALALAKQNGQWHLLEAETHTSHRDRSILDFFVFKFHLVTGM